MKLITPSQDAILNLENRVGAVDDLRHVRDLLALSRAVEAQDKAETTRLTASVISASLSSDAAVNMSEEFVNELVTRTFLMRLDAEATGLRGFFRALAAMPSCREPTDTMFGADMNLWRNLTKTTIEQAKFGNATEAAASIDNILNTFRIICVEARRLDFNEMLKERKLNYSHGFAENIYTAPDTLDSYFSDHCDQISF